MKTLFTLLFSVSCISVFSQATSYHPFPDSNAVWNMHKMLLAE